MNEQFNNYTDVAAIGELAKTAEGRAALEKKAAMLSECAEILTKDADEYRQGRANIDRVLAAFQD